jgi:acyl carrier protein
MAPSSSLPDHDALRAELVLLIVDATRREPVDPSTVSDATPCVGGSLLVDSLDVLEIVVAIDRVYGVSLRDGQVGSSPPTAFASSRWGFTPWTEFARFPTMPSERRAAVTRHASGTGSASNVDAS